MKSASDYECFPFLWRYDDLSVDLSQAKREFVFWKVGRTALGESRPSMLMKRPDHSVDVAHFANGRLFQRKSSINEKRPVCQYRLSQWLKKRLRWGTLIVSKCEMEDSHVKSLAGNRQRNRFRSQHR